MGTTVTAAYVGESSVTIAHVGDSRCYRVRDGRARAPDRGPLARRRPRPARQADRGAGRDTPAALRDHARARARAERDGRRRGVRRARRRPVPGLLGRPDVDGPRGQAQAAADRARGAAGQARSRPDRRRQRGRRARQHHRDPLHARGGRCAGGARAGAPPPRPRWTRTRASTTRSRARPSRSRARASAARRATRGAGTRREARGATRASDEAEAEYRASGTVALSAVRPRAQPIEEGHPHAPPRAQPRKRRRFLSPGKLIAVSCVIGLLAAFWLATRQVFFVGVDESRGNVVTLYKGLPYDLPLGIRLYSPVRHSGVTLQSLPPTRRATFTDHKLRPKDDAESLVKAAEDGKLSR